MAVCLPWRLEEWLDEFEWRIGNEQTKTWKRTDEWRSVVFKIISRREEHSFKGTFSILPPLGSHLHFFLRNSSRVKSVDSNFRISTLACRVLALKLASLFQQHTTTHHGPRTLLSSKMLLSQVVTLLSQSSQLKVIEMILCLLGKVFECVSGEFTRPVVYHSI